MCDHKCLDLGCSPRSTKPQGQKRRRDEGVNQQGKALGRQTRCCFGQGWGLMWLQWLPAGPNPDSLTFSFSLAHTNTSTHARRSCLGHVESFCLWEYGSWCPLHLCLVSESSAEVDEILWAKVLTLISEVHGGPWNPIRPLKYGGQLQKTPVCHCHVWKGRFLSKQRVR